MDQYLMWLKYATDWSERIYFWQGEVDTAVRLGLDCTAANDSIDLAVLGWKICIRNAERYL